MREAKRCGLSDNRLSRLWDVSEAAVRNKRKAWGVSAVYKRVDTCAAEFESYTPYLYSVFEEECEAAPSEKKKVMILGSGPNRIGQGIEFDACCCHAVVLALQRRRASNRSSSTATPRPSATDYDTADRLYFRTTHALKNVMQHPTRWRSRTA